MKVEQFYNKNQFRIYGQGENILQSYDSTVAKITNYRGCETCIILGRDWDYSNTTRKHVYLFLEDYGHINLNNTNNKRKYIQKLIDCGSLHYDENMY